MIYCPCCKKEVTLTLDGYSGYTQAYCEECYDLGGPVGIGKSSKDAVEDWKEQMDEEFGEVE